MFKSRKERREHVELNRVFHKSRKKWEFCIISQEPNTEMYIFLKLLNFENIPPTISRAVYNLNSEKSCGFKL